MKPDLNDTKFTFVMPSGLLAAIAQRASSEERTPSAVIRRVLAAEFGRDSGADERTSPRTMKLPLKHTDTP